jgi:glycosyltransferase involved in cell wall biosynthesis
MQLVTADETFGLGRGSVVVCVPVVTSDAQTLTSVRSVLEHTDAVTPVIFAGTSASLEQLAETLGIETGDGTILGLVSQPGTEVSALNAAIRASFPSDVALVVPGMGVMPGWLERLRAAATSDSTVASATPLSLGAGALELCDRDPSGESARGVQSDAGEASVERQQDTDGVLEQAAQRIRQSDLALHPRIATIGPGCAYIRRTALELAGPLDESRALDVALTDLAVRTTALGMVHVAADDVLIKGSPVQHRPPDESGDRPDRVGSCVQETIANDEQGPLRRSINRARVALGSRLSVTIDGRALNASVGGTQTYIIEMVLALARGREVAVRVLVPPDLSQRAGDALASVPDAELLSYEQALEGPPLTDVVHRPQQVFTPDDLALLRLVGERVVIGQQDLVAYHNHSYHPDIDSWRAYRRTTRLALAGADQVVFFSEHARHDALAEDLLPEGRSHVVGIGAETLETQDSPGRQPDGLPVGEPFLLCLGADYAHKNRPFAIELLGALRAQGWSGRLVLAGAHVPYGSSREREQRLLGEAPELAAFVLDLGPVDEPGRIWLYAHARALLYPTLYEGFGLLPLEAARADLPCLFAAQASLSEIAGDAATLVPWDAHASAAAVLPLLSDGPARDSHLARLRSLSTPGWSEVAHQLVAVYEHALAAPPSEAAPRAWQELDRENHVVRLDQDINRLKQTAQEYQDAYHSLEERVSTGLPLIDENGLLSPAQQRGLMRVAGRGRLGALAIAPLGLLGHRGSDAGQRTPRRRPPDY